MSAALVVVSAALTPSPLLPCIIGQATDWPLVTAGWWDRSKTEWLIGLDPWSARRLDRLARLEADARDAIAGETLPCPDLRAGNLMLIPDRVLVVDWPHVRVDAAWADAVFLAPSVAMEGSPDPADLIAQFPGARAAAPATSPPSSRRSLAASRPRRCGSDRQGYLPSGRSRQPRAR
ncbi:MAG: hypothetical protein AVDCRST_MAG70-1179 [uncultured Thermomicrobiales bacterium]|uniref:Aminoglycoside phosphotransferase domain-containing protein n=1 Tax=uncultured Thermomicrobiales bacterium TaxID=1645740 RepID=A0A6J4UNZ3_9BACT|nr:MAG: hypothetical protein AVDCRST_MAG70-1179 [uncultured Thermomicrobiales bacterium]